LQEEGYQIVACEDGQIAWETLQQDPNAIDLVVTDIEMPNMDGFELCIQIKQSEAHRHLPVVALTSLARDDDVQKGMRCGMADYLVKMDREKLVQAVASHLTGNDTSSPLDRSRCVGSYS